MKCSVFESPQRRCSRMDYVNWSIRKPPANVRIMIVGIDGGKFIGYRDTFDLIHIEGGKICNERPLKWKKLEQDQWGNYIW